MTPREASVERAREIAGSHLYVGDPWYSCPLSAEGCCDDRQPKDKCNCGYDERVERIADALEAQRERA